MPQLPTWSSQGYGLLQSLQTHSERLATQALACYILVGVGLLLLLPRHYKGTTSCPTPGAWIHKLSHRGTFFSNRVISLTVQRRPSTTTQILLPRRVPEEAAHSCLYLQKGYTHVPIELYSQQFCPELSLATDCFRPPYLTSPVVSR